MVAEETLVCPWDSVVAETTGCLLISHQVELILMVGGNVPLTMSREKVRV